MYHNPNDNYIELLVGAPYYGEDVKETGKVYLYSNKNDWAILGTATGGLNNSKFFGASVALNKNKNIFAVGAPAFRGSLDYGYVYVYDYNALQFGSELIIKKIFSGYDHFGSDVAFNASGNILSIGSENQVFIYEDTGDNQWFLMKRLNINPIENTVSGWGYNDLGSLDEVNFNNVIDVGAGFGHNVALFADGKITGWGGISEVQASAGNYLTGVKAISVGSNNTLAILNDEKLTGWGYNDISTVILGSIFTEYFGIATGGNNLTGVKRIWAGWENSYAELNDGKITGWGRTGDNGKNLLAVPNSLSNVKSLAASKNQHEGVAVLNNGLITGWGGYPKPPYQIPNIEKIYLADRTVLGLLTNKTLTGWGSNEIFFTGISNLSNIIDVALGARSAFAIDINNNVTGWGYNTISNINYGLTTGYKNLQKAKKVAVGESHRLAITDKLNNNIPEKFFEKNTSIDLNSEGNVLMVGNSNFEKAYVYTGSNINWNLVETFSGDNSNANFGKNVVVNASGNQGIVGADKENELGAVYLYNYVSESSSSSSSSSSTTINFFDITSPTIAVGKIGISFSYAITTSLPASSYSIDGILPKGLSFNSTNGVISGTVTDEDYSIGNYEIKITASDGISNVTKILKIYFLYITSINQVSTNINEPFNFQILANGSPDLYSISGLPSGLIYNNQTGLILGTPSVAGPFSCSIVISKNNGAGLNISLSSSITINVKPRITNVNYVEGELSTLFSFQLTADGSPTSYTCVRNTDLDTDHTVNIPNGLSFNSTTGLISGTPTIGTPLKNSIGTFILKITAIKNGIESDSINLRLKIKLKITNPVEDIIYVINEQPFKYSGLVLSEFQINSLGVPTLYFAEGLPNGLNVDSTTGKVTGAPKIDGTYDITFKIKNEYSDAEANFSIKVLSKILNTNSINAKIGEEVSYPILIEGRSLDLKLVFLDPDSDVNAYDLGLYIDNYTIKGAPNQVGHFILKILLLNDAGFSEKLIDLYVTSRINSPLEVNYETKNLFEYQITPYFGEQIVSSLARLFNFKSGEDNGLAANYKLKSSNSYKINDIFNIQANNIPGDGSFYISVEDSEGFMFFYAAEENGVKFWTSDFIINQNDYLLKNNDKIQIYGSYNAKIVLGAGAILEIISPDYIRSVGVLPNGLKMDPSGKIYGFLDEGGIFYIKIKIEDDWGIDEQYLKINVIESSFNQKIEVVESQNEISSKVKVNLTPLTGEKYIIEYNQTPEEIWASYDLRDKEYISGSGFAGVNTKDVNAFTVDFLTSESGVLTAPSFEYKEFSTPLTWSCSSFLGAYEKLCSKSVCYICRESRTKYKNNESSMLVRKNLLTNWGKYKEYFTYVESDDPNYYELIFNDKLFSFCCSCLVSADPEVKPPCKETDDSLKSLYLEYNPTTSTSGIVNLNSGIFKSVFFLDDLPGSLVTQKYDMSYYSGKLDLKYFTEKDSLVFNQYPFNYENVYRTIYNEKPRFSGVKESFIFSEKITGINYFSGRAEFINKFNNKLAAKSYPIWVPMRYSKTPNYINNPLISGIASEENDTTVSFVSLMSGKFGSYDISLSLTPRYELYSYMVPEIIKLQGSNDGINWQDIVSSKNVQPLNVYLKNKTLDSPDIQYNLIDSSQVKITGSYNVTSEVEVSPEDEGEEDGGENGKLPATRFTTGKYLCIESKGNSGVHCGSGFLEIEIIKDPCVPTGSIDSSSSSSNSSNSSSSSVSKSYMKVTKRIMTEKNIDSFRLGFFDYKNNLTDVNPIYLEDSVGNPINNKFNNYTVNDYVYTINKFLEFDNYKWIDETLDVFGDVKYMYGSTPFSTLQISKNRLVGFFPRYVTGIFTVKLYIIDRENRTTEHSIKILVNENQNPCPVQASSSSSVSSSSSSSLAQSVPTYMPEYFNQIILDDGV